jgi:hypothetical protein
MMTSILWGPLLFVIDGARENQIVGWTIAALLFPTILIYPLRPRLWSALLSGLGIAGWLLAGMLGWGINV